MKGDPNRRPQPFHGEEPQLPAERLVRALVQIERHFFVHPLAMSFRFFLTSPGILRQCWRIPSIYPTAFILPRLSNDGSFQGIG